MYGYLISFYIIMGLFTALIVLMLLFLLAKHRKVGKTESLSSLRDFVICTFLIVVICNLTSYIGVNFDSFARNTIMRIVDFALFLLMPLCWFRFIRANISTDSVRVAKFNKIVNWSIAILLVLTTFNGAVFLNNLYYVEGFYRRCYVTAVEIVSDVAICSFLVIYVLLARQAPNLETRIYIYIVSAILMATVVLNGIITAVLYWGKIIYEVQTFYYDPTFIFLILISVCTFLYIFKHDFSPIYFEEESGDQHISDEEILNRIAQENELTERETEILQMIFDGKTYQETAELLFISKYTVKNHVHNIYEKLDVTSRSQLIATVRAIKAAEEGK